ncbi:hypothetical protein [Aurantimonas sp. Leaf443]|uniref:hypothetical protein n=1 Tax=Aurantimonas sp. Leaf443 TaxID=1736378 RepID=UPI0012E34A9D|nr:hypothetical protein [Aurantimonas sp. Leaf443]
MRPWFAAALLGPALLAGCTSVTPVPIDSPVPYVGASANPAPRGSPEFCRIYASQSANNAYENAVDRGEDGFGMRALKRQQALRDGDRAYQRCLARR